MKRKYDFGGYATRNDLRCADGRVIRHGAFEGCNGKTVPLVWAHQHDDPSDVLGHAELETRSDGVYAYCTFNGTEKGQTSKELVKHGDIVSLSIYANQLKQQGSDVLHGVIREVSLVLAGANPGALIDNLSFAHGDGSFETLEDEAIIFTGLHLEHAADDEDDLEEEESKKTEDSEEESENPEKDDEEEDEEEDMDDENKLEHADGGDSGETVEEVFNTLTDKQKQAVYAIVGSIVGEEADEDEEGQEDMKHNIFDADGEDMVLSHDEMQAIIADAKRTGSLKDAVLEHGITNIEVLFPEAQMVGGGQPAMVQRRMEWVGQVINATRKSPFSRIKSTAANITQEEARARGYIKGKQKIEEQISALKRVTTPQTIYKLQKLDRDDIIDITDFDVVAWMKQEMRMMLDEELARAILVGDGRLITDDSKIQETNIRPVWTDDEVYSVHTVLPSSTTTTNLIDEMIKAKKNYRGSGQPTLYIGTDLLTEMRLLKDGDGYRRYKTDQELADDLRVSKIVEVELMDGLTRSVNGVTRALGAIIVNLADYTVGANKGGEVTLFDDFDLDYNKYEYLIETRCCGALYQPKSALVFEFATNGLQNVYKTVTPSSSENPADEGYYEKDGMLYVLTTDTTVASGKTYYELA